MARVRAERRWRRSCLTTALRGLRTVMGPSARPRYLRRSPSSMPWIPTKVLSTTWIHRLAASWGALGWEPTSQDQRQGPTCLRVRPTRLGTWTAPSSRGRRAAASSSGKRPGRISTCAKASGLAPCSSSLASLW
eukprot:2548025-Pyramimonas_sp.AAC.1